MLAELERGLDLAAALSVLENRSTNAARTALGPLLPRGSPWVRPSIAANPVVEHLVTHLLGGEAFIRWFGSNTALPMPPGAARLPREVTHGWEAADGMQHLHMDGWGWSVVSGQRHPTYKIFVNFALSDMSPENGSTQLWPATNSVIPSAAGMPCNVQKIDIALMQPIIQARAGDPDTAPVQVNVPRGGAMIRDLRCWHRGMPNYSPCPRHMMGVAYGAVHDPGAETSALGMGIHDHTFNRSCQSAFTSSLSRAPVRRNIKFVETAVDGGGRTVDDEGFALLFDEVSSGPELLERMLAAHQDVSQLPPWIQDIAERGHIERPAGRGRL